jgi:CheY-like chemotaxis protein
MSAIHGIIASHEGLLLLKSTLGIGTTFKVFLPAPEISSDDLVVSEPTTILQTTGGTILLVEDELSLRTMGTTLLESMGFSILSAEHGRKALEIHYEHRTEIDVIMLDLIMPVMGGIEAYHELRKTDPEIPIIISSGYGVESVSELIDNDKNAAFVHKPYRPEELRDVMIRMMGQAA